MPRFVNVCSMKIIHRILCRLGMHKYQRGMIIASLRTYWLQGGEKCLHCDKKQISFVEAQALIQSAYDKGITNGNYILYSLK